MKPILEVCTGNLNSVEAAVLGGARRIELCSALSVDGLTPSYGLLETVRTRFPWLTVHVLIRPREGDFVYGEDEVRLMERDIKALLPMADAIVGGALTIDGRIDIETTRRLIDASDGKPFTFHRAFDHCADAPTALRQLIDLGCHRVLTSGQQPTAEQGIPLLRRLTELAAGQIIILPGGGVTSRNARHILEQTGTTEIHASASRPAAHAIKQTSAAEVSAILQAIGELAT
jgi:copper homeostasis protein